MRESSSAITNTKNQSWLSYCLEADSLRFSLKTALIVGTILAIINHGYAIVTGHFTSGEIYSLLLTYCVPFTVSMVSQVQGKRQRDLAQLKAESQRGSQTMSSTS